MMSDTIVYAGTMTPRQVAEAAKEIAGLISSKAETHCSISLLGSVCSIGIYPMGMCSGSRNDGYKSFGGEDWPEVLTPARAWAAAQSGTHRNATIRRMALAIIEITDEHTKCTEALLRAKGFAAADIAEFHEAACVRAGEMAGNAPFVVLMDGVAA